MTRSKQAQRLFQQFNLCSYCSTELELEYGKPNSLTLDHVVPKSKGGRTKVVVCFDCNARKGARSLFNFLSELHGNDNQKIKGIFRNVTASLSQRERLHLDKDTPKGLYLGQAYTRRQKRHSGDSKPDCHPQPPIQLKLFD